MKHELLELRKEIGEKKAKTNQINLNKEQWSKQINNHENENQIKKEVK